MSLRPTDFDLDEPWLAHQQPERPLDTNVWLCDCDSCLLMLETCARLTPRFELLMKTSYDRVVLTAEYAVEIWRATGGLDAALYVQDDWIREVFTPSEPFLYSRARWWSSTLSDTVGDRLAMRKAVRKETPALRRRHHEGFEARQAAREVARGWA